MKDITFAHIGLFFIGLFMLGVAVFVSNHHSRAVVGMQKEQAAFTEFTDLCMFILPDGSVYIPAEEFDLLEQ